ncbi:hypothetical protein B9Q03_01780 [Candidatus Marsarchaeota G2 archaeon OSP_D]|jgi:hypothetical protein|uniref:Uncharacterized protein n=5 Tax=Candidatus Marsarchaeota group 2 TaxID=2203771 RepID=A0A2R6BAN6_9ARCH|nr:MAG: hypothetical protein B9Q03_01780 [Candidatus Marsarchaeota G2 archaeon OSP_D]PSN95724.1 MAG: hypothetical protein B9Q06_04985 [Candidatus Marsarchaeota G2 archaeon ECH_B_2]PSN97559.1 MAG: hypothetical protein B9Q09_00600 [Candidatus Marsarchaeota G2 archaeon ECH_B_SAG-C16]PSO00296.1 MAG: hypothetical protein B9Q07_04050 [Candidatus Marsarchaeota G2 archaeon ECH_B_3]PSO02437.1 MAG: hypothetical protein B9Q05_05270 [Candidatus Marsarchaeota G2 archaeon ECH_B_1]
MGEARVYAVHRYSLAVNIPVLIAGAVLIGGLLSYIVFALMAVGSLMLFFLAYLGEEKSYMATSVLGVVELVYSLLGMLLFKPWPYSASTLAYGVILVALGVATYMRFKRSRAEGKKALSDFVPPAFG